MIKIKWKVAGAPIGFFDRRAWPSARYDNKAENHAASIYCDDPYVPAKAKSGDHAPLKVLIADYSVTPWQRRTLTQRFATLKEAKDAVEAFLEKNPTYVPKD